MERCLVIPDQATLSTMKKLFLLLSVTTLLSACEVSTVPGPQGPSGQPGPVGPSGNANVKTWFFTVAPYNWYTNGAPGNNDHSKYVYLSIPELDQYYVDYGMVMVYLDLGNSYRPLPITSADGPVDLWMHNYVSYGEVEVDMQLSSLQTPVITSNYYFKVVAVDGYTRKMNPDIDWKDYNAVAKRFNLKASTE